MGTSHDFFTTKILMKQFRKVQFWQVHMLSFNDCKKPEDVQEMYIKYKMSVSFLLPEISYILTNI